MAKQRRPAVRLRQPEKDLAITGVRRGELIEPRAIIGRDAVPQRGQFFVRSLTCDETDVLFHGLRQMREQRVFKDVTRILL